MQARGRVLVVGDFDADGATSAAVAIRALRLMGHREAEFFVPNRFDFGYGLSPQVVELFRDAPPDLLITVDNGISSYEGVELARSYGIKTLITDHHLPPAELPRADAILNPNLQDEPFESKHLAGVGVAFYLMLGTRSLLRDRGWFDPQARPEPNLSQLLDLVALGTIADVVPLDRNNRVLVRRGLERVRKGAGSAGIRALLEIARSDASRVSSRDLAFSIAPRLNAAGRLTDMRLGIECLLSDDDERALALARDLDGLNRERKTIEADMQAEAVASVDQLHAKVELHDKVLVLQDPQWHPGIVGLLASRLRERYSRVAIVFAPDGEQRLKGSGRAPDGVHLRDVLAYVDSRNPGLIEQFGGHAAAAGLTIARYSFERLRTCIEDLPDEVLSPSSPRLETDGELASDQFELDTINVLARAEPFGKGFPEPSFQGDFEIASCRWVGGSHIKFELIAPGDRKLSAILFQAGRHGLVTLPKSTQRLFAVYRLSRNDYFSEPRLELLLEHVRLA
jgi:single-stranded-DNA-specific exonuclease